MYILFLNLIHKPFFFLNLVDNLFFIYSNFRKIMLKSNNPLYKDFSLKIVFKKKIK